MMRKEEADKDFKEKLQNPLRPINDTRASPDFDSYLKKLNDGTLKSEETIKKEREDAERDGKKSIVMCPKCKRQHGIKRTPSGTYCCGFCGLTSNSPLVSYE